MYLKFKTALPYPILESFAALNFKISSPQRTGKILNFKAPRTALNFKISDLRKRINFKISDPWRLDKIPTPRRTSRILKFYNFKILPYFVFFALSLLVVALASM